MRSELVDGSVGYIILHTIFQLVPLYNILITLCVILSNSEENHWKFNCLGSWLTMAIGSFLFYFFLIWIIEFVSAKNMRGNIDQGYLHDRDKDEDVLKEEERVEGELPSNSAV